MYNVVTYARISDKHKQGDGHSIEGQNMMFDNFCNSHDLVILKRFDEHFSSKTHERPKWRELMDYCRKNKGKVNYVMVANHERFSRNVMSAKIEEHQLRQIGIELLYLNRGMQEHNAATEFFNNIMLANAQFENNQKSEKVIRGLRTVLSMGGHPNASPFGYQRVRQGKIPTLEPSEAAPVVKDAFALFIEHQNQREVIRQLNRKYKDMELNISSSNLSRMLNNPVYIGKVRYSLEGETQIYDGIHQPIITENTYYSVQRILNMDVKTPTEYRSVCPEFPLRGMLVCEHGRLMTGSRSKSRHGYHVYYYHCTSTCPECNRINAKKLDEQIAEALKPIRFNETILTLAKAMTDDILANENTGNLKEINQLQKELDRNATKLAKVKKDYLNEVLDGETFAELRGDLSLKNIELRNKLEELTDTKVDTSIISDKVLLNIQNLDSLYLEGDAETRQMIVGSIMGEKLQIVDKKLSNPIKPLLSLLLSTVEPRTLHRVPRAGCNIEPREVIELFTDLAKLAAKLAA